ncbi:MAG: type II secretion system protein [Myxococcota bacterium]
MNRARFARRARHLRQEGMTLVEIMIVVIIMALIATAVGVAVVPRLEKARVDSTKTDAQSIRSAAILFLGENPGAECPSMDDLVQGGYIDASKRTTDAWDNDFQVECEGNDPMVVSAGPDGQFGTEDDIP